MTWNGLYPKDRQPMTEDVAEYVGGFKSIRLYLLAYFETAYKCEPKWPQHLRHETGLKFEISKKQYQF